MKKCFTSLLEQMCAGHDVVLCTVIEQAGSVPRGMGSQMVLSAAGLVAGTIGGGAGEKEMIAYGLSLLAQRRSGAHTCALRGPTGERPGSACGGAMTVYFHYIAADDETWKALIGMLLERVARRRGGWLIQSLHGGAPALLDEAGALLYGERPADPAALCRPFVRTEAYFSMPLDVGERAVLFGAGHCAQALVPLLASVGFRVTVYDDRPELAKEALFPTADCVICAPFDHIAGRLTMDSADYVVAMSSTHASDLLIMRQALAADCAYMGMIGSKAKRGFVFGRLLEAGVSQERLDRVHTPIGLGIQAVTPAEIAVSIAGEMILVRAQNREKTNREQNV